MREMIRVSKTHLFIFLLLGSFLSSSAGLSSEDDDQDSRKEQCREEAYRKWDSELNRCVNLRDSEDEHNTSSAKEGFEECKEIEDEEERSECFRQNATEHSPGEADYSEDEGYANLVMGAYAGLMALNLGSKNTSADGCMSRSFLKYTGTGAVLAELYFKLEAEKELEELEDEYEEHATQEQPFEAQIDAFKFLKKREEKVKDLAEDRITQYEILTVAYGATTIIALTELQNPSCYNPDVQSDISDENGDLEKSFKDDPAMLDDIVSKQSSVLQLDTPEGIAWTGGIGTGLSAILLDSNKKQKEEAEENIEYLEEVIAKLRNSAEGTCPNGRDDYQGDPACYCYTEDGERNPNRSNSQTCQNYWNEQDQRLTASSGDYSKEEEEGGPEGCMFRNGEFDQECKCRRMKNKEGENACLKVPDNTTTLGSMGNAIGANQTMDAFEKMGNGEMKPGDLDGNELGNYANRARKVKDRMIEEINKKRKKEGKKPVSLDSEKLAKNAIKRIGPQGSSSSMADLNNFMPESVKKNPKAQEALNKAAKEAGMDEQKFAGGGGLNRQGKGQKDKDTFSFGSGSGNSQSVKTKQFMDKKYDYKENDVVKKQGASIWKIISHRYNTTGLKRLFPEKKRAPSNDSQNAQ